MRAKTSFIINIAMSHRTPSHCSAMSRSVAMTVVRRAGANALSCTTSGQAGKYGSRPLASTEPSIATKDPGSSSSSWLAAPDEELRVRARPQVVGCDVVGDEVQDEAQSVPGQRGAGAGQAVASAQARVDLVVADAVRRPDDVLGSVVGQHGLEALDQLLLFSAIADPAGLRAHTPISHTASKPASASAAHRSSGTVDRSIDRPASTLS